MTNRESGSNGRMDSDTEIAAGVLLPTFSEPQTVYENQRFQVQSVEADFGPFTKEYFVVNSGVRAGMVAVKDGSLLLVQQYRMLVNGMSWEIPGGRVDDGEEPLDAAVRECLEESGVQCINPQPLIFYQAGMDTYLNPTHIFFCEEVESDIDLSSLDGTEVCACEWFPLSGCLKMISQGQIIDSFTIIAVLAYHNLLNANQIAIPQLRHIRKESFLPGPGL